MAAPFMRKWFVIGMESGDPETLSCSTFTLLFLSLPPHKNLCLYTECTDLFKDCFPLMVSSHTKGASPRGTFSARAALVTSVARGAELRQRHQGESLVVPSAILNTQGLRKKFR